MKEEKVFFKSGKLGVAGLLITPNKPIGCVVVCPGTAETKEDLKGDGLWFARNKFRTLIIDYIGIGESEGKATQLTLTNSIASLQAAIDFLGENAFVFGESFGGKVAMHAASQDRRIRALFLLSPASYIEFQKAYDLKDAINKGKIHYVSDFFITKEFAEDFLSYNLHKDVKNINCPVFITHGAIDKAVLPEGSKKLYSDLKTEKKLIIFPGVGHDKEMTDEAYDESLDLAAEWFKQHV